MSKDRLAQFANQNYISLQTFRKNGVPVATPVWFADDGNELVIYTKDNTGKVKRIRNNHSVRIAICDARGNLKGDYVDAEARQLNKEEGEKVNRLLTKKYGLLKRVMDFLSKFSKEPRAFFAIRVL